jgi:hypothetical protein
MEQWAILKTLSGSSPIFALSIHTTFSQTQTGATVPLSSPKVLKIVLCSSSDGFPLKFQRKNGQAFGSPGWVI